MNNLANTLHCEQLGSFHLMVNKEKVDGNFPTSTFEKTGFVTKKQTLPALSDTKKFKS